MKYEFFAPDIGLIGEYLDTKNFDSDDEAIKYAESKGDEMGCEVTVTNLTFNRRVFKPVDECIIHKTVKKSWHEEMLKEQNISVDEKIKKYVDDFNSYKTYPINSRLDDGLTTIAIMMRKKIGFAPDSDLIDMFKLGAKWANQNRGFFDE